MKGLRFVHYAFAGLQATAAGIPQLAASLPPSWGAALHGAQAGCIFAASILGVMFMYDASVAQQQTPGATTQLPPPVAAPAPAAQVQP